jgi:hypothetical protein
MRFVAEDTTAVRTTGCVCTALRADAVKVTLGGSTSVSARTAEVAAV